MKVLIVDDEFLARENLKIMIAEFCPELEIIGEASNKNEAINKIKELNPDLVFLDIRMPSESEGLDLIESFDEKNFQVIFVTAFKEYAIKAFQANATHYLLKPIDIDELISAVQKAQETQRLVSLSPDNKQEYNSSFKNLTESFRKKSNDKITISHSKGIKIIETKNIINLDADSNCTVLYFDDGSKYTDTRTLKFYEEILDEKDFFRIHKSHIINLNYLQEYSTYEGNFAVMTNKKKIPISRSKVKEFVDYIKSI